MRETTGPAVSGQDGPAYLIHSVDHALQLLLLFRSRPSLRVSEVADHLGVARSTAHRLLGMLVHRQFAEQDPATKTYRPGPRLVEIGLAAVGALDLRARLRPFLLDVAAATGETVSVLVLEHDMVHFIDSIESQQAVRVGSRLDARMPAHSTSAGKAILAALPADEVVAIYPAERLVSVTGQTTTTRTLLLDELGRVRAAGFATNFEESEIGLAAVGMALLDADERPVAAFTVAGPMQRMNAEYVRRIADQLAPIAAAASADLRLAGAPDSWPRHFSFHGAESKDELFPTTPQTYSLAAFLAEPS
jgi:IclR family transcriptional regulator, acetate operon repressor